MVVPTAKEMATAVKFMCDKLLGMNVLEPVSYDAVYKLNNVLREQGDNKSWEFSVAHDQGLVFRACADRHRNIYNPVVSVDGISVNDRNEMLPPLSKLDISLELRYQHTGRIHRWHFDQANMRSDGRAQQGPRYHLQFGGHAHDDRAHDMPIKEPRWAHPPMDLILLIEAVTANFYPNEWEQVRSDNQWCFHVQMAQRLCLTRYCAKLQEHINVSSGTLLDSLWGDRWTAS